MDAWVGFGSPGASSNRYLPDSWNLFSVSLSGQGVSGQCQLQVALKSGDRTDVYSRRISLHEGPLNEVHSFAVKIKSNNQFRFTGGNAAPEITVQLVKDGQKIGERTIALPLASEPKTFNVLALTKDGSGLNFLMKKKLGLIHHHFNTSYLQDGSQGMMARSAPSGSSGKLTGKNLKRSEINPSANLDVLYSDTRTLPTLQQAYGMVDAIVLADAPLDNLTEDQSAALKGFVRDGGLLIVSGGGDLARFKSQLLLDLLPIVPDNITSAPDLPELATRYHTPLGMKENLALIEGRLKEGASSLLTKTSSKVPLISFRPYGCGTVVFTSFDCYSPALRGWSPAPSMWRDMLLIGAPPVSPRTLVEAHGDEYMANNTSQNLVDAMAGKPAGNAPSFQTLAIFLGMYLILLIPVSGFVLKKLDRRELTWITAPCLIIGFSVASYLIARSLKGNALTLNRVAVIETTANSDQYAGTAQMSLYSPQHTEYDIEFGTSEGARNSYSGFSPSEIYSAMLSSASGSLTVEQDQTPAIRKADVRLWDKRSFGIPFSPSLGGPVNISTKMINEKIVHIEITNHTHYMLKNCTLSNTEQIIALGNLGPGETIKKEMVWLNRGGGSSLNLIGGSNSVPGFPNPDLPQTKLSDADALKFALAQIVSQARHMDSNWYEPTGDYGRVTTAFAGWFDDPIVDVTVDGKRPSGTEMNLLVTHIPTPADAPERLSSAVNPFKREPILDLEDEQTANKSKLGIFK